MSEPLFLIKNLSFTYGEGSARRKIFDRVGFTINQGESVAITGPSGSGKSTLFYLLGCMLRAQTGEVRFKGVDILKLPDYELSSFRNRNIGFVFQQFHLLQRANVLQNIILPTLYPIEAERPNPEAALEKAKALATKMNLGGALDQLPNQLSGGQQQRVAICRALMNDVDVILADEPTGNLDSENAQSVLAILDDLHKLGKTIIIITHDPNVAARCQRQLVVRDGQIYENDEVTTLPPEQRETTPSSGKSKIRMTEINPWISHLRLLPLALDNLNRNRMRSFLTMLGVIIGVAAVVAMLTLGNFARSRILEGYESLGVNRLVIYGYQNWRLSTQKPRTIQFTSFNYEKDLIPLKEIFPHIRYMSPVLTVWDTKVIFNGRVVSDNINAIGVNHEYFAITDAKFAEGRPFNQHHFENLNSVCVVGADIPRQLDVTETLVGQIITVTKNESMSFPCRVLGVMAPQKSALQWYQPDKQIIVPFSFLRATGSDRESRISTFNLKLDSESDIEDYAKRIKGFFDIKYDETGDIRVDSNTTLVAQMKRFLSIFSSLLVGIAILCLLVGGIGIQNMMLVSITDRLKEIGLRKALGATNHSVKQQILLESLSLCTVAGLIGILVGIVACSLLLYIATQIIPDLKFELVLDPTAMIASCAAIVIVGIVSGFAPAVKAEQLQVMDALRAE